MACSKILTAKPKFFPKKLEPASPKTFNPFPIHLYRISIPETFSLLLHRGSKIFKPISLDQDQQ